jgi:GntR family transcriptional regulator
MRDRRPLPHQVRDQVLELLVRDKYGPGDRIPTEQQLLTLFQVSRPTLREGLRILEQERILRSKHGSGRYLLAKPDEIAVEITELQSVTELLAGRNIRARTQVLEAKQIPSRKRVAEALNLELREPVIKIERIRYANQEPIIYSLDLIPCKLAKTKWTPADFKNSLLEFLEKRWGIFIDHTQTTIHAITLDKELATRIKVAPGLSWVLLEQINFDALGTPIIYSEDYHRGNAITFYVTRQRR